MAKNNKEQLPDVPETMEDLETEEKAKRFCYKRNTSRPYRFHYEEWEVGEVLEGV